MTNPRPDGRILAAGAAWIGLFRWTSQVLSWAAMLLVIRLLAPADYGLASLAMAIVGITSVLSEFGLGTAIIALPELPDRVARQVHGGALLLGLAVGAVMLASAPLLAWIFREPLITPVLRVLSLVFVAEAARLVPVALLSRRLAYRTTAMLDFLRAVATSVMVLGLAWAGQGYWALVLGNLFGAVILSAVVTVRFGLVPAWPRTAELATPLSYARHILVGRIAWVLYRNSDILIAGRLLGSGLLGYYSMAWNVASLPGEKLGNVLTAATAPFFAAIQADRPALRHYFLRVTEALSLVLYPLLFGFLAVADLAVPLVLGEKWIPAVPVLRILIVFAAINAITTPVSQVLNVTGHTRTGMLSGLIALGVLPPAFLVGGMLWGMSGIAGAWIVGYPIVMLLPVRTGLRTLEIPLGGYLGSARRAVEGVAVLAGAVWLVRLALPPGTSGWLELVGAVLAGAVGYLGLLWWRHRGLLAAVPGLLRGRG